MVSGFGYTKAGSDAKFETQTHAAATYAQIGSAGSGYDLRSAGGDATGVTAIDSVLNTLLAQPPASGRVVIPAGTWNLQQTHEIPTNVIELVIDGDIVINANVKAFTRTGTFTVMETLGSTVARGSLSATVANGAAYAVGDWLLLYADDTLSSTTDKYGCLRRIWKITGNTIFWRGGTNRVFATNPRITKVTMSPRLRISGNGTIRYADQAGCTSDFFTFTGCDAPSVEGSLRIYNGGHSGIIFEHCIAPRFDAIVTDLLDDINNGHTGYGVSLNGATRGGRILGRMARVRHAVTTNPSANYTGSPFVGEPEQNWIEPYVADTTANALDSHRSGWANTYVPHVTGASAGGVQIRADNTFVQGGEILNCSGFSISVSSVVAIAPVINDTVIVGHDGVSSGSGAAVHGGASFRASNLVIRDFTGTAVDTASGATARINGIEVTGTGSGTAFNFAGTGSRVVHAVMNNVTTTITNTGTDNTVQTD